MLIDFFNFNKNNRILPSMKEMNRNKMEILGLMSGTSLDGVDIAHVSFEFQVETIEYELLHYHTFSYSDSVLEKLQHATQLSVEELLLFDKELGVCFAEMTLDFLDTNNISKNQISAIASHGHTVYHQPHLGFTLQIGCGSTIAYHTGINVVNDFRSLDVIAGGQGAPLVPIGDFHLFGDKADAFLNLGGFSNISFKKNGIIQAFDVSPANLPSNLLMQTIGKTYDDGGELAKSGTMNEALLKQLNALPFYVKVAPKSLGIEWLNEQYMPLLTTDFSLADLLCTHTEHVAIQVSKILNEEQLTSVFITGGGAKNSFFLERLQVHYSGKCIIPSKQLIDFKEAIVFAFLGARHLRGESTNVPSVTGASKELCTGAYHRAQ